MFFTDATTQNPTGEIVMKAKLIAIAALAVVTTIARAETATTVDQVIKDIKNPMPWVNWGGDLRLRNEYFAAAQTLGNNLPLAWQDYFRFRGRLWATVTPLSNVVFNARLTAEPRLWENPSSTKAFSGKTGIEWRYGILDSLNLKLTNLFDVPMSATLGRQDIMIGEPMNWWLVADGTPGDGAWTFFFDAARLNYEAKGIKTKFDVAYLQTHARPGDFIPVMGPSTGYYLTEQDEQGVILNVSNTSIKNTTLGGFFIWKNDSQVAPNGDNGDIYTIGGNITCRPNKHIVLSAEGAYQFGEKQDPTVIYPVNLGTETRDISSFGCNARASYLFLDKLSNQVSVVAEFLSGDDPNTQGTDEMFDIQWGRYPRWSEIYVFSYAPETGNRVCQINNLQRFGFNWTCVPFKRTNLSLAYNALFTFEATPTRRTDAATGQFSYNDKFRGNQLQTILKHQFNKYFSATLLGEWVFQGDFYSQRDVMVFLRAEIGITF
jgi:hypothetical protein